ncbi:MAG: PKD domain-containing protein [Euryarchaeota archaeon]|nr:PKD domain-containing protein [Euryarchaeota archaeon]MBT5594348.1 PKD domain-containing protein [Euryarchaeota archaeon]
MSELRSNTALLLVTLLFVSGISPLLLAVGAESDDLNEPLPYNAGGVVIGDIADFEIEMGNEYLMIEEEQPVVSAFSFLKQEWIDAGRPGVEDMVYEPQTSARAGGRACNSHVVNDQLTVPTSGGSVDTYVAKTTTTVAFLVQSGRTLSSTVLNNLASSWDQTIYPTMTTYYGKDYQDGRGLAPPDVDNNCQVQIIIYDIDGAYNIGGYFAPSMSNSREAVFVDYADITLSWGKSILAHELEHLLHNAQDPYENLWIDEGNADVAIYLCFGADSTLVSHLNQWTQSSELSVRWWNQRFADYGAGFIFTMYLADHLGGGPAIRQLVQDSATGGLSVENLAISPVSGQSGMLGRTMGQIFANFSIAAVLDSPQGIYGFSNLDLTATCSSGSFCRVQPADTNSDWAGPWSSTGHSVEGWGIRAFKFTPGASSPAPLTMRLTADVSHFDGVVVSRATADGLWSATDLNFQNNVATALIPGFGNLNDVGALTDEIWAITWYASTIADCDYTSCGPSYPQGTVDIEAARITSPATLDLNTTILSDRDGDGAPDTAQINYEVFSNAFFEDLDVTTKVLDNSGIVVDTQTKRVSAGGGVGTEESIWFTAPYNSQYTFQMEMKDMIGTTVDTLSTSPQILNNMKPTANGTLSPNESQTWENIQFNGDGFDAWGLSYDNNSLPYLDPPVAYAWDFGDTTTSGLKSPYRFYRTIGQYNATLRVQDQGGSWSDVDVLELNITDNTPPIPLITVNSVLIEEEISILTNQMILFSASLTFDNVPTQNLSFQWDWGDGMIESGIGMFEAPHEWGDIDGINATYNLTLTVSDGINLGVKNILVHVNNRVPYQIFSDILSTDTYTSIVMPDVFKDSDGSIVSYSWFFPEGVNLDGGVTDREDEFTLTTSNSPNPTPSWDTPGLKSAELTVVDDDGSSAFAMLSISVLNQIPVADFIVKTTTSGTSIIDFRVENGQVETPYTFDGRSSFDPDGTVGDSSDLTYNWSFSDDESFGASPQVTHSFSQPGVHTVTLIVTDAAGEQSIARILTVEIANPLPIITVQILDAWYNDEQITDVSVLPELTDLDWTRTFNEQEQTFAAPHSLLYFDSDGTRDGDQSFEGKYVPLDVNSPDWNGLVQYTWDFGDGSPLDHSPTPWHAYSLPGEYIVTLTVRDAFGTGDVSRAYFTVIIDYPPIIHEIFIPDEIIVSDTNSFMANISDIEVNLALAVYRDTNVNDGFTSNRDETLTPDLLVRWDMDIEIDADNNGNPADDWVEPMPNSESRVAGSWSEVGTYTIRLEVCDSVGICDSMDQEISVIPEPSKPPSLSDFSVEDWKSWLADAGSDLATFVALIAVALILGWLVMREPSELEDEAKQAAETYTDVEHVENQGGLLGMDHHAPPPAPGILSKEERRSDESGYIRPLRRRG